MWLKIVFLLFSVSAFAQNIDSESYRRAYIAKSEEKFKGLKQDFFEINESYIVLANYKLVKKPKGLDFPTSSGRIKYFAEYAVLKFKIKDKKFKLTVYKPLQSNPIENDWLFLPLKDLTAPHETYGGGRYLDFKSVDFKNGKIEIDFNKLYNPYCAFSDGWSCPIPPENNLLKTRIEAGEKLPLSKEKND